MDYLLLGLAGFVAGAINSVAGGGILVVFPAFLAAGLSPLAANITSNLIGWPGGLAATYGYRRELHRVRKNYFLLLIPCFLGSAIGVVLLRYTPSKTFDIVVPWLVLSTVLLFAFQPTLHRHIHRPPHLRIRSPLYLVALGLFGASVYGGYFGGGVGFMILALLSFTKLRTIYQIAGVKNLAVVGMGLIATLYFSVVGGIEWRLGIPAMIGAALGGFVGARYAHRVSPHLIRAIIVGIGLVLVCITFLNAR